MVGLDNNVKKVLFGVISVIVLIMSVFFIVAGVAPELIFASNNITNSNMPLANLFSTQGLTFILFMLIIFVVLILAIFRMVLGSPKTT